MSGKDGRRSGQHRSFLLGDSQPPSQRMTASCFTHGCYACSSWPHNRVVGSPFPIRPIRGPDRGVASTDVAHDLRLGARDGRLPRLRTDITGSVGWSFAEPHGIERERRVPIAADTSLPLHGTAGQRADRGRTPGTRDSLPACRPTQSTDFGTAGPRKSRQQQPRSTHGKHHAVCGQIPVPLDSRL